MGHYDYLTQTEKWMNEGKCPESVVRKMNAIINEEIMKPLMHSDKEKYWKVMRDLHQTCEGMHYNEAFAMWEVAQMHHTGNDGKVRKGAHWTLDAVQEVFDSQKANLSANTNVYDLFVGLNSFYHDNCSLFKSWFGDDYEAKIIESAINYFFKDEDAPEGKVWRYYRGMRESYCNV